MMLIEYFYNITSERRLAEEIFLNLAYIKATARHDKEVFEEFFNQILKLWMKRLTF